MGCARIWLHPKANHLSWQSNQLETADIALAGLGDELDNHHAFVIRYGVSGAADMDLAPHRDDSEVTFNMALGRSWRGCDLNFCGRMQEKDVHQHRLSHHFPGL